MELCDTILLLLVGVMFLVYGSYGALMFLSSKKKRYFKKDYVPSVALIVCTYNEEEVIERKIKNILMLDYPREKLKVVFVDSGSTDKTMNVIGNYLKDNPNFRLYIQERRMGQNSAENFVMPYVKDKIVVTTDAEVLFNRNSIKKIVKNFAHKNIGAVTGEQLLLRKDSLPRRMESIYKRLYYLIRKGESNMDSTFHVHGDLLAFRRKLWKPLNPHRGADDASIAFNIRRKGYRVIHDSSAVFYESPPQTLGERELQKRKRAAVLFESIFMNLDMLFNRKFGVFGCIILPANFFMLIISPFVFLSILILSSIKLITNFSQTFLFSVPFVFILFMAMFILNQFSSIGALIRVFLTRRGKNVLWEKTVTTRHATANLNQ